MMQLLEMGETTYSRRRLEQEARRLMEVRVEASVAPIAARRRKSQAIGEQPEWVNELKAHLWKLREEQVDLKSGLRGLPDPAVRKSNAKRIMAIERERVAGWKRIDHYKQYGEDLSAADVAAKEPGVVAVMVEALIRRRNTVRTYIKRSGNPTLKAKYQAELAELNSMIPC